MKVLLVEDDKRIASFIRRGLKEEQFTIDVASDGEKGLFLAQTGDYDILILDVMLPKMNGIQVVTELRNAKMTVPVLMLTAKDELQDKVAGLNAGADDYLTKPFGFEELLARLRALSRRRGELAATNLKIADLEFDLLKHRVTRSGSEISLTTIESKLLEYFLRRAGQVVTRTMLSEQVWEHDFDTFSNVIDVHIARLRKKIDDGFAPKLLHTVRGRGYVLQVEEDE